MTEKILHIYKRDVEIFRTDVAKLPLNVLLREKDYTDLFYNKKTITITAEDLADDCCYYESLIYDKFEEYYALKSMKLSSTEEFKKHRTLLGNMQSEISDMLEESAEWHALQTILWSHAPLKLVLENKTYNDEE